MAIQYRIGDGVRRALAAREMGKKEITAKIMNSNQQPVKLPLDELGVTAEKLSVVRDQRFINAVTTVGSNAAAPIEVYAVPSAASNTLVSVLSVRLLRWNG